MLEAAGALPPRIQGELLNFAISVIADHDLTGAVAYAANVPNSSFRLHLLRAIATSHARQDPHGAVQWAQGQVPRSIILDQALVDVASSDLRSSVELALLHTGDARSVARLFSARTLATAGTAAVRDIADLLLDAGDAQQPAVSRLMASWTQMDPESALAWVLENRTRFEPRFVADLASGVASSEVALAANVVDSLPLNIRGEWITEVAAAYFRDDPQAADQWLAQFRFEPDYDEWVTSAAEMLLRPFGRMSGTDPGSIAALLSTAQQPGTAATRAVAIEWAKNDARAAAEWARSLADESARTSGLAGAVGTWWREDSVAAERWTLGLPRAAERDGALAAMVTGSVEAGDVIGSSILSGFTTNGATAQAFLDSLPAFRELAAREPERARTIARESISDAGIRTLVEAEIEYVAEERN